MNVAAIARRCVGLLGLTPPPRQPPPPFDEALQRVDEALNRAVAHLNETAHRYFNLTGPPPGWTPQEMPVTDQPPRAADLPNGSVVASADVAFIRTHPSAWTQWRGTNSSYVKDSQIDDLIAAGATVLRHGTTPPDPT